MRGGDANTCKGAPGKRNDAQHFSVAHNRNIENCTIGQADFDSKCYGGPAKFLVLLGVPDILRGTLVAPRRWPLPVRAPGQAQNRRRRRLRPADRAEKRDRKDQHSRDAVVFEFHAAELDPSEYLWQNDRCAPVLHCFSATASLFLVLASS